MPETARRDAQCGPTTAPASALATSPDQRHRRLRIDCSIIHLVVDELGYLLLSQTGAVLFFQLMSRRYEHASTVMTSNKGFEEPYAYLLVPSTVRYDMYPIDTLR